MGDQHDAIEELMSLSPFEMRNLLHHIMAGDEFHIDVQHSVSHSFYNVVSEREAGVSKVVKQNLSVLRRLKMFCIFINISITTSFVYLEFYGKSKRR